MEIILPLLNLRDKIKKISLENSWTSNVGCGCNTSPIYCITPLGFQGLFPFSNNVPSVCTERGQTGSGAGTVKSNRRAGGEEDKKV